MVMKYHHYLTKPEVIHLLTIFENLLKEMHKDDIAVIFDEVPDLGETTVRYNKEEVRYNKDLLSIHLSKILELEELVSKEIEEINSIKDGDAQYDIISNMPSEIGGIVENVYTRMVSKYDCEKMQSLICRK